MSGEDLTHVAPIGDFSWVETLIQDVADVNHGDEENGNTPLFYAASEQKLDITKALIKEGAEVNKPGVDGMKPLMMAALNGNHDVAFALVEGGAHTGMKNSAGKTAVDIAIDRGHSDIMRMLVTAPHIFAGLRRFKESSQ